jgi:hypothetical protein
VVAEPEVVAVSILGGVGGAIGSLSSRCVLDKLAFLQEVGRLGKLTLILFQRRRVVTAVAAVWPITMMRGKRSNGGDGHHDFVVAFLEPVVRQVNLGRWAKLSSARINIVRAGIIRKRY